MNQQSSKLVGEFQFFEELWGFPEVPSSIPHLIQCNSIKNSNDEEEYRLTNPIDGRQFLAGTFLIKSLRSFHSFPDRVGAKFNIVIGNGTWTSGDGFNRIDVGALQANPANRGATFQVASNFNCLEFVNENDSAARGISKYVLDHTQGPAASISASPGTLFRNYFVKHVVGGKTYEGQLEQQINLLDGLFIPVRNGYISFDNPNDIEEFEAIWSDFDDLDQIKVGIQKNVQVTSGEKRNGKIKLIYDEAQIINQVFTAAINLGGKFAYSKRPKIEKLAKLLLKGAYRATILSAIENSHAQSTTNRAGKDKLYLTMIGGGVFSNSNSWIVEAIYSCCDLIKKSGLQIFLIIYTQHSIDETSLETLKFLVMETGGRIDVLK